MATMAGYEGKVVWGTVISDVGYNVHAWSMDVTVDPLETTDFADAGNKTFIRGLKSWSGSVEVYADSTNNITVADVGSSATVQLYVNATKYWSGSALCTGWHPAVAVDGVVSGTLDFQGSGLLTYT